MYLSEAYILMMSELACAGGLIIMNGKGAVRSTVGLAIAFVAYTVLLGMLTSYIVSHSVKNSVVFDKKVRVHSRANVIGIVIFYHISLARKYTYFSLIVIFRVHVIGLGL